MPQLDFTTPLTTSQVVWGAIIFVVLYILLSPDALAAGGVGAGGAGDHDRQRSGEARSGQGQCGRAA